MNVKVILDWFLWCKCNLIFIHLNPWIKTNFKHFFFKRRIEKLIFLNAIFIQISVLAFYRQLYGPCLVYTATMIFSIFYHACDQESFSGSLPSGLQITCLSLYVNNEVLQFCDFFSAILSFWVTVSFILTNYFFS